MTRTPTSLSRLYAVLTDLDPECGRRAPVWRCTGTMLVAATALIWWAAVTGTALWLPFGIQPAAGSHIAVLGIFNLLTAALYLAVVGAVLDLLFGECHYHCDECSRCSADLGVKSVRNPLRARQLLREAGWALVGMSAHYCPKHVSAATEG